MNKLFSLSQSQNTRPLEILMGKQKPTTWFDLVSVDGAREIERHMRGNSILVHALRCYFASGNDMSFCVHYIPKTRPEDTKSSPLLIENRQTYRGGNEEPGTPDNVWKTCGVIRAVTPTHIHISDRSQKNYKLVCSKPHNEMGDPPRDHYSKKLVEGDQCTRKKGCDGRLVKHESWAEKQLIITNIVNVTNAEGSPLDFSSVLSKYPGFSESQRASLNRADRMKNQKEELRQSIIKDLPSDSQDSMRPEASLTPEDEKQQIDYWSYYDPEYAKKMIKEY